MDKKSTQTLSNHIKSYQILVSIPLIRRLLGSSASHCKQGVKKVQPTLVFFAAVGSFPDSAVRMLNSMTGWGSSGMSFQFIY
jgi:hypothetical protein